jgi:hypothetical protein
VSREKVREYAVATGVEDPAYTADSAEIPSNELIAPPTFAACFTVGRTDLFDDPELGAHTNLVHGSQSYELHQPIRVGRTLVCSPQVTDIVDRGRMELLTLQIDCADEATGEPVVTSRGMIIFFNAPEEAD